jgi:hypothetical protein
MASPSSRAVFDFAAMAFLLELSESAVTASIKTTVVGASGTHDFLAPDSVRSDRRHALALCKISARPGFVTQTSFVFMKKPKAIGD